jgi:hypothetical protein
MMTDNDVDIKMKMTFTMKVGLLDITMIIAMNKVTVMMIFTVLLL